MHCLFIYYNNEFYEKPINSSVQLVQEESDWKSLAKLSYTLIRTLVIKLYIAAVRETQNNPGF